MTVDEQPKKRWYNKSLYELFKKEPTGGYWGMGCNFVEDFKKAIRKKVKNGRQNKTANP